jgi:hypothetical protein
MKKNKFAGFTLFALFILAISNATHAQKNVVVDNTNANPVPAVITNTPATPVPVVISNNTPTNPLSVRDVGPLEPFSTSFAVGQPPTPAIPAGKLFVVEHISGNLQVPSLVGGGPCRILGLSFLLGTAQVAVVPVFMGLISSGGIDTNYFTISQPVRAYVPSGPNGITISAVTDPCNGSWTGQIVWNGHLVDTP